VIGSSLEALMFAFNNELPVFFSEAQRPFRFDYLSPNQDLSSLCLENVESRLKTFGEDKKVGIPKELLWERLMFLLSYCGKVPAANLCKSMRYTGENLILSNEYSKIGTVEFNHCYYFGDNNCHKLLNYKKVDNPTYICYDWISFNRGGKHNIDYIETDDAFVKQIWFYPSDRIDGNTAVKDACVVSHLTDQQLLDFDYSETMARFKMIHEMEKRGMKGKFNGYGPNGKPKHYKFRTTHLSRRKQKAQQTFKKESAHETKSPIEIPKVKEEDLLRDCQSLYLGNHRLLRTL